MGLQTNASRAMHAGLNALYGQPVDDAKLYDKRIDKVSIADLQAFAQKRFTRTQRTQLVVRPA
jgi:zinc protease